ncbi:MAG: hypothetical protein JSW66_17360 [Phycisphaerales bacterium]|nr:MAG: hypothetical protein JSW66_17360 [Phycisphaerales bacterium]
MILNNPLIRRYRYSLMRPRQLWVYVTIYATLIGLLVFLNYAAYKHPGILQVPTDFFASVCYQLLVLQVLLLCAVGAYNSGSAIRDEITGKSYDFFRMLPISAGKKAVGVLVGKNLVVLLFGAANFVLIGVFGNIGRVDSVLLQRSVFALISLAILVNSVALLASIHPNNQKKKSSVAMIIILLVFVGPFLIRAVAAAWRLGEHWNVMGKFYTVELPALILAGLVALYLSAWSIIGVLRRFTREDEPLFTRTGACLFMIGYEFVLLGLFYSRLTKAGMIASWVNYCYWLISLLPALAVPVWSLRRFEKYLEYSGLVRTTSGQNKSVIPRMLLYSNLSLDLGLFAVWAACSIGTTLLAGLELVPHLYMILVLFSFHLFLVLLLELYVVCTPISNKIGLLLVFVALLYVTLPVILHWILDSQTLYLHSPGGFLFGMFRKPNAGLAIPHTVWMLNLLLCAASVIVIWKRHVHILRTRRAM